MSHKAHLTVGNYGFKNTREQLILLFTHTLNVDFFASNTGKVAV